MLGLCVQIKVVFNLYVCIKAFHLLALAALFPISTSTEVISHF